MNKVRRGLSATIYIYIYIVVALLTSNKVFAESSPASVVIPASYCNVSTGSSTGPGSSNTTDTPHVATINNGTYKEDIGITTFKVVCGDNGGYSIYAIGYSNNEYGNNKLLATVGNTLSPSFDILTGTALSGNVSNWAMKLIPVPSTFTPTIESDSNGSFSNYHIVPSTYTKVATFPSVTDDFQGSSFKSTYRAYVSPTQPAGSYVGKVRYTMVHPADEPAPVGIKTIDTMQEMTSEICDATPVGTERQLTDIRDNKVYWVAKLADNHCWMTQNLDLNLDSSVALTSDTTDLNTVSSWTPIRSTINAVTNASTAGSIQGYANDDNTPYSVDTGDYYWKNLPFYPSSNCSYTIGGVPYQGCNYVTKTDANWKNYFSTTPYASNGTHGHVGNYYNWSAAVASNDTSSYTASTFDNIASNPQNSICPKGWRLPTVSSQTPTYDTAGSPNEFARLAYLYDNYTGNTSISSEGLEKAPLYMPRPGYVNAGVLNYAGNNEHYWSSTVSSAELARRIGFNSTAVYPEHEHIRYGGFSLRCVAR